MDRGDIPTFLACLAKLGKAHQTTLDQETMEIYFEDLAEFSLSQVLEAMTWARKNLNRFPKIAELRTCIEGDPEELWQRAWTALINLLPKGPEPTVTFTDRVMAKTIQDLWRDWARTVEAFRHIEGDIAHATARKVFQVSYLANWKRRHELPNEPVTFPGFVPDYVHITTFLYHYRVADYTIELVERRRIDPPERKPQPITPEMQARIDAFLGEIGKRPAYCTCSGVMRGWRCTCKQGKVYDASHSAVPGGEDLPAPDRWDPADYPLTLPKDVTFGRLHLVSSAGENTAGGVAPDAAGFAGGEQPADGKVRGCTCYECYCGRPCRYGRQGGENPSNS
jgi:hypothetical protein